MGNILNHNRLPFDTNLSLSDYWDFSLYLGQGGVINYNKNTEHECLSAYIDTTFDDSIIEGGLASLPYYSYSKCKSDGVEMKNIGLVGMDNGLIRFDKDCITIEEFSNLLLNSVYTIDNGDCRLKLFSVDGNNVIYDYSSEITTINNVRCLKLNGGFVQGFFSDGRNCKYKVLPISIDNNGWGLEFEVRRKDFINRNRTLNKMHPENKGIFFYMGTRAENKWAKYYKTNCDFPETDIEPLVTQVEYVETLVCPGEPGECFTSEYFPDKYIEYDECNCVNYYNDDYFAEKKPSGEHVDVSKTKEGHYLDEANLVEIETDNKFILFDRSCKGLTTKTYQEGDIAVIQYKSIKNEKNYFTLFNRSCDGMTVNNYSEYMDENGNDYDIYNDLYRNAFALQIKDDGSIGYKYLVRNCESDYSNCSYKIESEFSNPDVVAYDEWCKIHVKILKPTLSDNMRLMFYVNGKLRLVSKELPVFDFRELNDMRDKQEGVPFNISLGGGTQGLSDVIYNDYETLPKYIYPLETEFGGTFIGYIKSFKFYECALNFNDLARDKYTVTA